MRFFAVAALVLMLVMAAPVVTTLTAISPHEVAEAFVSPSTQDALRTSLAASLIATALACVLGIPAAFALARTSPALRNVALAVIALPLAFPPIASGIMLIETLGIHAPLGAALASHGVQLVDSLGGVAVSEFFVAGSFVAIAACAAFSSVDPIYEEAARTMGANVGTIFFRIAMPLAAPGILAGVLLAWMRAIGEYGATSVVAYHPASLPIQLYVALSAQGVRAALALAYGFIILALIVVAMQWTIRRRIA